MQKIPVLFLFLILSVSGSLAQLTLPPIFADHMVLQREQAVPVWGQTDPNVTVVVTFAGQEKTTRSDVTGQWRVDLDALSASTESRELKVSAADEVLLISDVLVGEVWLCGGQSNMDYTLGGLSKPARDPHYEPVAAYLRKEIATANDRLFRHFKVSKAVSAHDKRIDTPGTWTLAIPEQVKSFTATGYFFGRELRHELNVPVALLSCNWGGTLVEAWVPAERFSDSEALQQFYQNEMTELEANVSAWDEVTAKAKYAKALELWKTRVAEAKSSGSKEPSRPRYQANPDRSSRVPATLYNGMLHSLIPYGIKGAIWYQGESNANASSASAYQERFTALIEGWRELWGQETLYFYWCQLANFKSVNEKPVAVDYWATVCDQQRRTLELPNTGMAVLNDIGESKDIHPKNKVDVGKRLSLWALQQAYGQSLVVSGPLYQSHKIEGNKMQITFDYVGSGLMVGHKHLMDAAVAVDEPLKRFQIAGKDGQWKWAAARIISADTIEVWHPEVVAPLEVRYAWSANPEGAIELLAVFHVSVNVAVFAS
ncbi:sialate O-acetylesterase [Coraliomargarita sp. W4R53]